MSIRVSGSRVPPSSACCFGFVPTRSERQPTSLSRQRSLPGRANGVGPDLYDVVVIPSPAVVDPSDRVLSRDAGLTPPRSTAPHETDARPVIPCGFSR